MQGSHLEFTSYIRVPLQIGGGGNVSTDFGVCFKRCTQCIMSSLFLFIKSVLVTLVYVRTGRSDEEVMPVTYR